MAAHPTYNCGAARPSWEVAGHCLPVVYLHCLFALLLPLFSSLCFVESIITFIMFKVAGHVYLCFALSVYVY